MPKEKLKPKGKVCLSEKRKTIDPNVTVYTDLPPDVHGELRCYLMVILDNFVWTGKKLLKNEMKIVAKWWGEQSQGTYFNVHRLPGVAKYAIKCGPRQFSSYLNDMKQLTLDFVDTKTYQIKGEAKVDVIKLSKNNLILNDATITVPLSSHIVGKINVKMNIVPAPKAQVALEQPNKISSSTKQPTTVSAKTSPIKILNEKDSIFPSKHIQRTGINDIINQVLQKSRHLKEQLVKVQMEKADGIENFQEEIKANIDSISPDCIQEIDRCEAHEPNLKNADNTVDFLFGKDHIDSVLKKHGLDLSMSSNSSTSSLHDESLIEHLFYNRGKSYSPVSSDSEAEDIHEESKHHSNEKKMVTASNYIPCDQSTALPAEESYSLSFNKITALGRVNKCKLFLGELYFDKKLEHGSYFVEYNIPVGEDCEAETLISRKISDRTVLFEHTNVFPLLFDEVLIHQWQVKTVVFKIFYKEKIENSPKLFADASVRLRNVIEADRFELKFSAQIRSLETDDYLGLVNGVLKLNSGEISEMIVPRSLPPQKTKSAVLNLLISVVCGKALQTKSKETVNSYVVTRMIDSLEKLSSEIVWDSHHPVYNCRHVVPFTYTTAFIDRLKENYIIIEVWNKTGNSEELVGLTKLPTSQFYLSLSGDKLLGFMEESSPIVAVDGYMPVMNVLSNERCGILQCVLAVGSHSQLTDMMSQKNIPTVLAPKTPAEKPDPENNGISESTSKTRHMLSVTVNTIQDMVMFEGISWGATDCFVSFSLPTGAKTPPDLKTFSSSVCSSAPHMKFNHKTTTSLILPDTVSLLQFLSQTLQDNSVVFELWRRFYYPNIRDQMCAKGSVTLQQLSHLVSLNSGIEQTFQIPLTSVQQTSDDGLGYTVSTLSVTLEYNHDTLTEVQQMKNLVQLCVGVQRACGLQYAAENALNEGAPIEHAVTVGVDSYVSMELSFAGIHRESSVKPRSFTPNYGSHFSLSLPTVMSTSHSGPPSLAENISKGSLLLSVFHKVEGSTSKGSDILLCKTTVPLESLLHNHTGVHGWFPLQCPSKQNNFLAALELEVGFGELTEREQVISDACRTGWIPPPLPTLDCPFLALEVHVDRAWIADSVLMRYKTANDFLYEDRQCYLRIKFYDSDAVCSDLITFSEISRDSRSYCGTDFTTNFTFAVSTNLVWCLREEALEIQMWLIPRGGQDSDVGETILGCGYVSLSSVLGANHSPVSSAQVVGLVKATSGNMGGAGLHVTTTLTKLEELVSPSPAPPVRHAEEESEPEEEQVEEEIPGINFRVTISHCTNLPVEQYPAASLCLFCTVTCNSRALFTTPYHPFNRSVHLNYTQDITIPYSVFSGSDKTVTCCVSARDVTDDDVTEMEGDDVTSYVIGSAIVDLAPLLIAFPCIEGWYLIEDVYSKDTFGQIKASFTPLELVTKEIISSKMGESGEVKAPNTPIVTNFLKKTAKRNDKTIPTKSCPTEAVIECVNIENVFKSLADIDTMIKSIGANKTNPKKQLSDSVNESCDTLNISKDNSVSTKSSSSTASSSSSSSSKSTVKPYNSMSSSNSENLFNQSYPVCTEDVSNIDSKYYRTNEEDSKKLEIYGKEKGFELQESTKHKDQNNLSEAKDGLPKEDDFEDEGSCPLLDTFDITVDTTCLSNTINDITLLLQSVQRQSHDIEDSLDAEKTTSKGSSADEIQIVNKEAGQVSLSVDFSPPAEEELIQDESETNVGPVSVTEDLIATERSQSAEIPCSSVEIPCSSSEIPLNSAEITCSLAEMPSYPVKIPSPPVEMDHYNSVEMFPNDSAVSPIEHDTKRSNSCRISRQPDRPCESVQEDECLLPRQFSENLGKPCDRFSNPKAVESQFRAPKVPDFFTAAKELSTTLTQLKQQRKPPDESQDTQIIRSSTPVMGRRTPLCSLMGQGPNSDQRARIARIFRQ